MTRPAVLVLAVVALLVAALAVTRCSLGRARQAGATATAADRIDAASVAMLERGRAADGRAGLARSADQTRRAAEAASLEESTDALPSRVLSDRQRARLGCVRDQQAARAAGRPVPACGGPRAPGRAGAA